MKSPQFKYFTTIESETLLLNKCEVIPASNEDEPNLTNIELHENGDSKVRVIVIRYNYEKFREWWLSD